MEKNKGGRPRLVAEGRTIPRAVGWTPETYRLIDNYATENAVSFSEAARTLVLASTVVDKVGKGRVAA